MSASLYNDLMATAGRFSAIGADDAVHREIESRCGAHDLLTSIKVLTWGTLETVSATGGGRCNRSLYGFFFAMSSRRTAKHPMNLLVTISRSVRGWLSAWRFLNHLPLMIRFFKATNDMVGSVILVLEIIPYSVMMVVWNSEREISYGSGKPLAIGRPANQNFREVSASSTWNNSIALLVNFLLSSINCAC